MHDSMYLEKKGIRTVTLVHGAFERAARTYARFAKVPDPRLVVLSSDGDVGNPEARRLNLDNTRIREELADQFADTIVAYLEGSQGGQPEG